MVDVMNLCGVDYVCLGNHETQISWEDLKSRARESKFTWINSNMPGKKYLFPFIPYLHCRSGITF